jgi:hypothetical protein
VITDASTCPQTAEVKIVFQKNFKSQTGTIGTGCLIDSGSSDVYVVVESETHPRSRYRFDSISGVLEVILHRLPELDWLQERESLYVNLEQLASSISSSFEESEPDDK